MKHEPQHYAIAELVPHAGAMSLLDRVSEVGDEHLVAEVEIRAGGLFGDADGVPAWVGIEYMAQAIAAWAGWRARQAGGEPKIGFLLGTRRYVSEVPYFAVGRRLQVDVRRQFIADNGLGQFECRIREGDEVLATAALNVFEPEDPEAFLRA